ncbi:MAG: hypothetical protein R3B99_13515 [Polyangiales bacterium]|nr:hypothetical protein [Myxococcales bacterium]MCB9601296.1 hypothetical protein [Sandaracinus sp.]
MNATTLAAAMKTQLEATLGAGRVASSPEVDAICTALANAIVSHLSANADVRITTSTAGLQRDPSSGDPTLAPSSAVVIAGALE